MSNVADMSWMFTNATAFNQDIGNWDMSSVIDTRLMLENATAFNQDISRWNVSNVIDMSRMFYGATAFDQNIGEWDVSSVLAMENMFVGVTLSTANYDALLIGWAAQTVKNDVEFHAGNSKYSPGAAADARAVLTGTYSWTITDGGELDETAINSTMADNIGVYPNPFQNTINISNASNVNRVVISNIVGKAVMVVDLNPVSNQVIQTNLPTGIYLVTIIANDGSKVTRKMIRE
ncbi:MAG: BspA family leucine-rich repeat surface protein [Bacteroidales bacterium]|nr:BspA family leucine-rich repeat surface protein [Bacteroidales bacterium]MDD4671440.1 BspA family leucine-rich repeat surface protein [Bacteroidales bacterium]MDY0347525.1 BspA family leucine-rich repeat surface protein [Tenuifilaceae bacterium]